MRTPRRTRLSLTASMSLRGETPQSMTPVTASGSLIPSTNARLHFHRDVVTLSRSVMASSYPCTGPSALRNFVSVSSDAFHSWSRPTMLSLRSTTTTRAVGSAVATACATNAPSTPPMIRTSHSSSSSSPPPRAPKLVSCCTSTLLFRARSFVLFRSHLFSIALLLTVLVAFQNASCALMCLTTSGCFDRSKGSAWWDEHAQGPRARWTRRRHLLLRRTLPGALAR
mmetsp:Transcript_13306/g.33223  ORF Transcript_13306/g.33223 Transcript_13306/m.33223 type:complete len:226 (-) Transcript_13306:37-714(-)